MKAQSVIATILGIIVLSTSNQAHAFRITREVQTNPGNAKFQQLEVEDSDVAGMHSSLADRFRNNFNGAWQEPDMISPDGTHRPGLIWGNTVSHQLRSGEVVAVKMVQSAWYMKAAGFWGEHDSRLGAFEYCLSMNPNPADRQRIALELRNNQSPSHGIFLPRKEDFIRLRIYMGGERDSERGYSPQLIPIFSQNWYVTSTIVTGVPNTAYAYSGFYGSFFQGYRQNEDAVVCVKR